MTLFDRYLQAQEAPCPRLRAAQPLESSLLHAYHREYKATPIHSEPVETHGGFWISALGLSLMSVRALESPDSCDLDLMPRPMNHGENASKSDLTRPSCSLHAIFYFFMFFPYDLMASQASMLLGGHDPHLELQNATKIGRQHFEVGIWP